MVVEKNKKDWNDYAGKWGSYNHSEPILRPVLERPERAFHGTVWGQLCRLFPGFEGKKICVPSSGDNLAVFAFARLGAQVLSCDIAENQLENARKVALREGLAGQITFLCADTMKLEGVGNGEYDLVSVPVRFCNFSPNGECKKMADKGVQPLNDYTCRFRPSSLKCTDKSGLDGLQTDKWNGNQGCLHLYAARRKITF